MMTDKDEHCWLCDKEMKGYVFWYPNMKNTSSKIIMTSDEEKQNIYRELNDIQVHETFIPAKPKPYVPPQPNSPGRR